ncbi:hypothetical protein ACOSQ4_000275 [Xanthoceras sorbifolium]
MDLMELHRSDEALSDGMEHSSMSGGVRSNFSSLGGELSSTSAEVQIHFFIERYVPPVKTCKSGLNPDRSHSRGAICSIYFSTMEKVLHCRWWSPLYRR